MSAFVDALSLDTESVKHDEIRKASTTSHNKPGTTSFEISKVQPLDLWDLKQHGRWEYWGDHYGWKRQDIRFADHVRAAEDAPWTVVKFPPKVSETQQEWHDRRLHTFEQA